VQVDAARDEFHPLQQLVGKSAVGRKIIPDDLDINRTS